MTSTPGSNFDFNLEFYMSDQLRVEVTLFKLLAKSMIFGLKTWYKRRNLVVVDIHRNG